jgi:hypothetical protein
MVRRCSKQLSPIFQGGSTGFNPVGAFVVESTVDLRGFDDLKRFLAAGSATGTAGTDE